MDITITLNNPMDIKRLGDVTSRTDAETGESPDDAAVTLAALRTFLAKFEQSPEEGGHDLNPKIQNKAGWVRIVNQVSSDRW